MRLQDDIFYTSSGFHGHPAQNRDFDLKPGTEKVPILPTFAGPDTVMALTIANMMLVLGTLTGRRRKRDTMGETKPQVGKTAPHMDSKLFFKLVNDMDEDDCLASALCYVTSIHPSTLNQNEMNFMLAFRIKPDQPLAWNNKAETKAKYQYASFIGRLLQANPNITKTCSQIFPKCLLDPKEILSLLMKSNDSLCRNVISGTPKTANEVLNQAQLKEQLLNAYLTSSKLGSNMDNVEFIQFTRADRMEHPSADNPEPIKSGRIDKLELSSAAKMEQSSVANPELNKSGRIDKLELSSAAKMEQSSAANHELPNSRSTDKLQISSANIHEQSQVINGTRNMKFKQLRGADDLTSENSPDERITKTRNEIGI